MKSFKQMRIDGETKRAEAAFIELGSVHFDPDFNAIGRNEESDEEDDELFQFIMDGHFNQLPAWEVYPREEGGVWIVEGHRRTIQTRRAVAAGAPLADKDGKIWIPIKPFVGSDLDRLYRVNTSNKRKLLKPHQFADQCKKARGFNQTNAQIAAGMGVSRAKVDQALMLADANHYVQEAVKSGTISATEAVKQVRQHGEKAGAVIKEAVAKAPQKDKAAKVTAASFAPAGPNARHEATLKALNAVHTFLASYVESREPMDNAELQRLQGIVAAGLRAGTPP